MKTSTVPTQIDQVWKEIVRLTEVPHAPGLLVLGSFARRVTVYSQQLRALNVVDALAGLGYLRQKTRVAVVGAGFSGLTAAAALAKMGVTVSIFDRDSVLAGLQTACKFRYLHPHIYEWPLRKIEEVEAGLPFLSWSAGNADAVVARVAEEWRKIAEETGIINHCGSEVLEVKDADGQWELTHGGKDQPAATERFDLVILAVGFGVEKPDTRGKKSYSYWADLPLKYEEEQRKQWLVSGAGDGALTDVMQLCVRHKDHEGTLWEVVKALHETVPAEVLARLERRAADEEGGEELFAEIDPVKLAGALKLRDGFIYLNASREAVFGTQERVPMSATINRLVVWMLEKLAKVRLEDGRIEKRTDILEVDGGYSVNLKRDDGSTRSIECEDVLLRHGPVAVVPDAEWLSRWRRQLRRLKRQWRKLYESKGVDPTLHKKCKSSDFEPRRLSPALATFGAGLLYSADAFEAPGDLADLKVSFRNLLKRKRVKASLAEAVGGGSAAPFEGIEIAADVALTDPRSLALTVQALCHAPLLLVAGNKISAALALLLGIRAAVRRGVTIMFHKGELNIEAWKELPFNLRELRIVPVSDCKSEDGFRKPITTAIEAGFRRLLMGPTRYGDLPGFGALRNLGANEDENAPRAGRTEVLVLCPFDATYSPSWLRLRDALHRHYYGDEDGDQPATRVVDMNTPELLSRRLFEAIRRDEECVADLSLDKPNVLIELGTRLAVHKRGARVIRSAEPKPGREVELVGKMFGVGTYSAEEESVLAALAMDKAVWAGGAVSASFVHVVAERCVAAEQEAGGSDVLDVIWDLVANVGGADRQKQAVPPILFRGNHSVRRNARQFIFDGLLAYCLLARRGSPSDRTRSRLETAAVELGNTLRDLPLSEDERTQWDDLLKLILKPSRTDAPDASSFFELVGRAKRDRIDARQTRDKWKASGASPERDNEFEAALTQLQSLIATLETAQQECEEGSLRKRDLSGQLAETFGALGGLYRDWDKLREAISAYQKGDGFEREVKRSGGLSGSYCLVQSLVNQVLLESRSGNALVKFKDTFADARQELVKQLNDDRRGDPWLQADIALVTQLLDPAQATDEWEAFEDLLPSSDAYRSAATVMNTLFTALEPNLSSDEEAIWRAVLEILK